MSTAQQIVLVTGGASGIGLATVERLVEAGAKVAIGDLDSATLENARRRFADNDNVVLSRLDVTDEAAVETLIGEVEAKLGALTGVVNSAGIAADAHVFDTSVDLFRKVLDVNVVGTFIVARAAARRMRARGQGSIVNIGSIAGLRGSKGRSAYGSSKGAVVVLTQVMANDLARTGIRVNAVAPGPVDTPLVQRLHTAEDRRTFLRFVPMRRYGTPDEVASVICFLLDERQSSYVTGEIIAVDGGFRGAGLIVDD